MSGKKQTDHKGNGNPSFITRNERPSFFSIVLPSSLGGYRNVSGAIAGVVSVTFLNYHRLPIDDSQAEQASSTPGQLLKLTESRKGNGGNFKISKDS